MTEDKNIELLKERWQKLGSGQQSAPELNRLADDAVRRRAGSLTLKVRKEFRITLTLGIILLLCGPLLLLLDFSLLTAILYVAYGLIYISYIVWQRRKLATLDDVGIPCVECARRALTLRKAFDRYALLSLLLAVPVLYSFFVDLLAKLADDPGQRVVLYFAITGGVVGGIMGLLFDLRTRRRLLRIYRTFVSEGSGED